MRDGTPREGQGIDPEKFRKGYGAIDFSDADPLPPSRSGRYVVRKGKLVSVEEAGYDGVRKRDATNMRSDAAGIHPDQVPEWNREFAGTGTQFDPVTGEAVFKNRQAKLKHLKARGMVDFNEVRGGPSRYGPADQPRNLFLEQ